MNVNEQLKQIIDKLRNKVGPINKMKAIYSLDFKIFIVIRIEDGKNPSIYLDKEAINFASSVEAEIDIDLYIYSI